FRGQLFGVLTGDLFGFAERVMLGKISVHGFVGRKGQADARGDEPVRFTRGIFADDRERNLSGLNVLQPFAAGNQFAIWRENGSNADDVARRDSRATQS